MPKALSVVWFHYVPLSQEQYGIFCSQIYRDVFEDVDGDGKLDSTSKTKASVLEFFEIPEDKRWSGG